MNGRVADFNRRDGLALPLGELTRQILRFTLQRQRHELSACLNIDYYRRIGALDVLAKEQRKALLLLQLGEQSRDLVTRRDRLAHPRYFAGIVGLEFGDETTQIFGHRLVDL